LLNDNRLVCIACSKLKEEKKNVMFGLLKVECFQAEKVAVL